MAREKFDIGSKWLLQHQGRGVLLLGGLKNVRRCQPMPGELAQARRYPDGLLQVFLGNDPKPHHVLIEVATYAERRALKQALDDLALAYGLLRHLPELLMLVLRPKGKFRIEGRHEVGSKLGLSRLSGEWKAVELWTLPAEEYLAAADVGVVPWVPLMHFDGPPEPVLERCRERIERDAPYNLQGDLLAISQVLAGLRFPDRAILELLGGDKTVIESPLVEEWGARGTQEAILALLKHRFGTVPAAITKLLKGITKKKRLTALTIVAYECPDLEAFREALLQ